MFSSFPTSIAGLQVESNVLQAIALQLIARELTVQRQEYSLIRPTFILMR